MSLGLIHTLILVTLLFSFVAQFLVNSRFKKYSRVATTENLSGAEAAQAILDSHGITDVEILQHKGFLSDHYNPLKKTLNLSPQVYQGRSIAAVGIAAHEVGHAIQHARHFFPLQIRSALVPVTQFSSSLVFPLFILGIFLGWHPMLINAGIVIFGFTFLFSAITLPVEFDASRRAVAILHDKGIVTVQELAGVKKVLTAAAMTYVASAVMSLLELLRFVLLSQRR